MENLIRVLLEGPVLLLGGIVLLMFGASGYLSTGRASHSRPQEPKPYLFAGMTILGLLGTTSGLTLLLTN